MRSVRLPILVPHMNGNARTKSASEMPLRCRGPSVSVRPSMPRGVRAIELIASSCPGAGCVNRLRSSEHKVPRSRSSSGHPPRGLARSFVSAGSAVEFGGVCRCARGKSESPIHTYHRASFGADLSSPLRLYLCDQSAYGRDSMRQPNYAFERTVMRQRNHRWHRAAAQRER